MFGIKRELFVLSVCVPDEEISTVEIWVGVEICSEFGVGDDEGTGVCGVVVKGKESAVANVGDAERVGFPASVGLIGGFCPVHEAVSTIIMKIRIRGLSVFIGSHLSDCCGQVAPGFFVGK